jgi:hypothetical protein
MPHVVLEVLENGGVGIELHNLRGNDRVVGAGHVESLEAKEVKFVTVIVVIVVDEGRHYP